MLIIFIENDTTVGVVCVASSLQDIQGCMNRRVNNISECVNPVDRLVKSDAILGLIDSQF